MINYDRPIYLKKLYANKDNGLIKVLTGIRQSGKTFILMKYFEKLKENIEEKYIFEYKLESNEMVNLRDSKELEAEIRKRLIDNHNYYIYIDEVQMCDGFENVLLSIKADYPNADFYITGSNSRMLSKDILKKLGTNGKEIKVFPLSYEEFILFSKNRGILQDKDINFEQYINIGGMPSAVLNPDEKNDNFEMIINTVIKNDIVGRYENINEKVLINIIKYISSTYGNHFSYENVFTSLKKSISDLKEDDVSRYISYLIDSFFITEMEGISVGNETLEESNLKKFYVIDHGLANYIGETSFNRGNTIENIAFIELQRNGIRKICLGKKLNNDKEIDFTFIKDRKRFLFQVTEKMPIGSITEKREFNSFKDKSGNKIILTVEDYNGFYKENFPDVKIVKMEEWLLGDKFAF